MNVCTPHNKLLISLGAHEGMERLTVWILYRLYSCTNHAIIINIIAQDICQKQAQNRLRRSYCQPHAQDQELINDHVPIII